MAPECYFAVSWATLEATFQCPKCDERHASHVWPDYYHEKTQAALGPDLFLCSAHAGWFMDRSLAAVRQIRLIESHDSPEGAAPPAAGL